jgi:hypothetical protein
LDWDQTLGLGPEAQGLTVPLAMGEQVFLVGLQIRRGDVNRLRDLSLSQEVGKVA